MTRRSTHVGQTAVFLITEVIVLATLTMACGAAAQPSSVTSPAAPPSVQQTSGGTGAVGQVQHGFYFKGTITITGAVTVTTTFTQLHPAVGGGAVGTEGDPQTCATAATVGDANFGIGASGNTWQVPSNISDISAPAVVNVTVASNRWKGPGAYGVSDLLGTSGVRIHDATYYDLSAASAAALSVNPDGSGSLTFQRAPVSGQSAPAISGNVTWTCINHGG
jgi:hypothetical protein